MRVVVLDVGTPPISIMRLYVPIIRHVLFRKVLWLLVNDDENANNDQDEDCNMLLLLDGPCKKVCLAPTDAMV